MRKLLLILLLAILPKAALAQPVMSVLWACTNANPTNQTPALIQSVIGAVQTTITTPSLAFTNTVGVGNSVAGTINYDIGQTLNSVTDDKGNNYVLDKSLTDVATNQGLTAFHAINLVNSPKTITGNFSGADASVRIALHEYSNVKALDKVAGQTLNTPGTGSNAVTSGSITTSGNGELIYATTGFDGSSATVTAGTGFTLRLNENGNQTPIWTEDQVQTSAGAISGTFTTSNGTLNYMSVVLAFTPTTTSPPANCGGGGGGTPNNTFFVAPNGNDIFSGTLPAPNGGNTDGPFLTLSKCKSAMEVPAALKTCTVRAGTFVTATLAFTSSDNGQTWQFMPSDGVNSAIVQGSGSPPAVPITFQGVTGWTWNGIKINSCPATCLMTPASVPNTVTIKNSDISGSGSNSVGALASGAININGCSHCNFDNNFIHDTGGPAIALGAFNLGDTLDGTIVDSNVLLRNSTALNDSGPIYLNMRNNFPTNSGATSNHVTISNNFVGDYGFATTSGNGFRCIYLDDDSSLVTVTGNICRPAVAGIPTVSSTAFMNGGDGNTWTNNVFDQGTPNTLPASGSGFCGQGGGVACTSPTASPNKFNGNIVLMNFSGANSYNVFSYGNHQWGSSYFQGAPGGAAAWISVSGNLYHNAGGGSEDTTGTDASDTSPTHANPGCLGNYVFSSLPGGFVDPAPARRAGPPGFVIPAANPPIPNSCH